MVTTRSGRKITTYSRNTVRENITMNIKPKKVSFIEEEQYKIALRTLAKINRKKKETGSMKTKTKTIDYIYRTINIQDMTDFQKLEKYYRDYSNCFYILSSSDKNKIVYDYCSTNEIRENVCQYLMYNNEVLSTTNCKLYVVLTNKSYMFMDRMIDYMNATIPFDFEIEMYKHREDENYIMTDSKFLNEVIHYRDIAVQKYL